MYKYLREYINSNEFKLTLLKNRINIINYDEIIEITDKEIILKSKNDKITIIGEKLALNKLLDNELLITGNISNIEVLNG